ncbi:MAG: NAD(P)/FAD-dependent oxidoreductase [Salinirussus sp.]
MGSLSIAVVGGGITGAALAYHLRDSDHDVTVYERDRPGAGTTGKSIASFGWHLLGEEPLRGIVERSWSTYEPLIADGRLSYREIGLLFPASSESVFADLTATAEAVREAGAPAAALDPGDVADHGVDPGVASAGAAWYPTVGRFDPTEVVSVLVEAARAGGVGVRTGVEVTDVRTTDGAVTGLVVDDGEVDADVVVNAAGPWAPAVDAMAGVSLPLRHSRAPISVLDPSGAVTLPTVSLENGVYFTGQASGRVLAGHAPHAAGETDPWAAATRFDDPDDVDGRGMGSTGETHREAVAEHAPAAVPELADAEIVDEWRGIRCLTPDGRPMVGPTAVDGYLVATGMSGWGMTLAPGCGELLAASLGATTDAGGGLVDGMAPLVPGRFADSTDC